MSESSAASTLPVFGLSSDQLREVRRIVIEVLADQLVGIEHQTSATKQDTGLLLSGVALLTRQVEALRVNVATSASNAAQASAVAPAQVIHNHRTGVKGSYVAALLAGNTLLTALLTYFFMH